MGMDSKDPQVMWGPITLAMSFPFVAYVFRLPGAPVVCLTAHLDEHRMILDQSRRLLEITLTDAKQRYEKWQQIACLHTHVEPGGQQVRVDVYQGNQTEPERVAEANLRGLTYSFVRTLDGTPCEVTQYAPEPERSSVATRVSSAGPSRSDKGSSTPLMSPTGWTARSGH